MIAQIRKQAEEINRLQYGEVVLKIQDGRLIKWDMRKSYKVAADSNNGRPGLNA